MRVESIDRGGAVYKAVRLCLARIRDYHAVLERLLNETRNEEQDGFVPAPKALLQKHDQALEDLGDAIEQLTEALEPLRTRLHFSSENVVSEWGLSAPTWAEVVEAIAVREFDRGWSSETTTFHEESIRRTIFHITTREVRERYEGRPAGLLEAELAREEARLRSGVPPARSASSNGLWRLVDGEVVFSPDADKLSDQSLRILEQLILAKGYPVPVDTLIEKAWSDRNAEPSEGAIRQAVSTLRKELEAAGYDDIARRIPRAKDSAYRLRME